MRGINGDYYPRDDRSREKLQLWSELYTMDQDKIEKFYQDVKDLPEVTSVSLERNLDWGGILLQPGQIQKDLQEFEISGVTGFGGLSREEEMSQIKSVKDMRSGKWIEGYYLRTVIVGLDDDTFQNYVEAAGCQLPQQTGGAYSVLIEDYEEVRTSQGVDQRSILDLRPGDNLSFYYSRYGDMDEYTVGDWYSELDEIRQGNFTVIGTTQEPPPYPYFSGMQDNIDGYQERTLGICHMYMSMSDFKKLLEDPAYNETYGEHPTDTYAFNYESRSIATYVKFKTKGSEKSDEGGLLSQLMHGDESSSQMEKEKRLGEKIKKIAENAGLTQGVAADYNYMLAGGRVLPEDDTFVFNSRLLWQRDQYFHSEKFFQLILGYGLVLLIAILALTNIFQNISTSMRMRRKEFSAYQSIGMSSDSLRNMLLFEAAIYGVSGCLVGMPVSFLILYQVYISYKENYAIRWEMPWDMVPVQIAFAILIIVIPVVCAMSQLKNLNIIDSIRMKICKGADKMEVLRTEELTKEYGFGENKVIALDHVSFSVEKGEFVTILGPSGSGKSTLLHLVGGVDRPTHGQVFIGGQSIYKMKSRDLTVFRRREIGQIYQFYNLIPVLDVKENISLPVLLDHKKVDQEALQKLLEILGLEKRADHLPNELSGGQQQRVAIGRALISQPQLLLADEPTGNLDQKNSLEIINLFKELNEVYKQTILLITHDEKIAGNSSRIIRIEDGKIIKDIRR